MAASAKPQPIPPGGSIGFACADDHHTSIDVATALTCDGEPLPPKYGFPLKLRIPTQRGDKNPKHVMAMFVANTYPGGYWEDQGYNGFGGS